MSIDLDAICPSKWINYDNWPLLYNWTVLLHASNVVCIFWGEELQIQVFFAFPLPWPGAHICGISGLFDLISFFHNVCNCRFCHWIWSPNAMYDDECILVYLCPLSIMWPWENYFISLNLSFPKCKNRVLYSSHRNVMDHRTHLKHLAMCLIDFINLINRYFTFSSLFSLYFLPNPLYVLIFNWKRPSSL